MRSAPVTQFDVLFQVRRKMAETGREVVTLQLGNYSNFVGAHFWNIQVKRLGFYVCALFLVSGAVSLLAPPFRKGSFGKTPRGTSKPLRMEKAAKDCMRSITMSYFDPEKEKAALFTHPEQ